MNKSFERTVDNGDTIKKLQSTGEGWRQSREWSWAESNKSEPYERYLLGANCLHYWDYVQQMEDKLERTPETSAEDRERISKNLALGKTYLAESSQTFIKELRSFIKTDAMRRAYFLFCSYFASAKDFDQTLKKLGITLEYSPGYTIRPPVKQERYTTDSAGMALYEQFLQESADENLPISSDLSILIDIIRSHRAEMDEKQRELQQRAENYKTRLKIELTEAIKNGTFPLSQALMDERLENLSIKLIDTFKINQLRDVQGEFSPATHTVAIREHLSEEQEWTTYVHEAVHALSGQTELGEKITTSDAQITNFVPKEDLRIGLHNSQRKFYKEFSTAPKLFWLNEAVTEHVTHILTGLETNTYSKERGLLRILISKGVSEEAIYAAYFENYGADDNDKHTNPALKKLFDNTNAKFGKRFLADLDLYVEANKSGAVQMTENVAQKWEEMDEAFPSFIHAEADRIRKELVEKKQINNTKDSSL